MKRMINVGCGVTPTPGWENYDNSPSVFFAQSPLFFFLAKSLGFLAPENLELIQIAKRYQIRLANATKHLPLESESVDAIYTCHMLEHLDRQEAVAFLGEAYRVLKKGGVLRIVVPDFRQQIMNYLKTGDMDNFLDKSLLTIKQPKSFMARLKLAFVGPRHHLWMYDEVSLNKFLQNTSFVDVQAVPFGTTTIVDPGSLDLMERSTESICLEAKKS